MMKGYKSTKSFLALLLAVLMLIPAVPVMQSEVDAAASSYSVKAYTGAYSSVNGTYGGVDDLGRYLTADYETSTPRAGRYVGIFYFLWQGEQIST